MNYKEAQTLIAEAHKLGYRGTEWEQNFLRQLEFLQPKILTPVQASAITEFYRRASGGSRYERRQIVNGKHRYQPEA